MRSRGACLAILLLLAARPAGAQTLSPGPLSEAHANLDDDNSCGQCHAQGKKVDNNKCLVCHEAVAGTVKSGTGLHGKAYRGQDCASCHVEHIGKKARLIRWPGGDKDKLDHAQTGWALTGGHAPLACAKCHSATTRSGRPTFIGLRTACATCHKDPHQGRFGATCESCHKDSAWKDVKIENFDHGHTRFPLVAKHIPVECKKCHGEPAKWTGLKFDACSDCHKDPHAGKFVKMACTDCHTEKGWKEISEFTNHHPGVRLSEGHAKVTCEKCHDRGNDKAPSKGSTCVSCHRPVHVARFGNECKACHESIRWLGLPRQVGLAAHDKTRYPLAGRHVEVTCEKCHDPKKPGPKRFRDLPFQKCTPCHTDRHTGEFAARPGGGDCAGCHTVQAYTPTTFGVELHAATAFPLEGRHAAAPCVTCHPGRRPRLDLHVTKKACADCHANPHGEQFATEMAAGGCVKCHTTTSWGEAKVDHSTWPLVGAHARTSCARCHGEVERKKGGAIKVDTAQFRGVPRTCEGCHADVHAGQFRLNAPVRACDFCHDADHKFKLAAFDHEGKTGYKLTGKHVQLACDKCHLKETLRNGETSVRWRLGYQACKACHADPHE